MRYFIKRWLDSDGKDNRARGAFREGLEHLLPAPTHAGVWSLPKPLDFATLPPRISEVLEREGYYLEVLATPLTRASSSLSPQGALS